MDVEYVVALFKGVISSGLRMLGWVMMVLLRGLYWWGVNVLRGCGVVILVHCRRIMWSGGLWVCVF